MGVSLFFSRYIQKYFLKHIKFINKDYTVTIENISLLLDLNGIIHRCCQKVYKYNKKEVENVRLTIDNQKKVFYEIINEIDNLIKLINPKILFIAVDGTAPKAKACQQRTRRFKKKEIKNTFDSNCISPGTKFMEYLHTYIKHNINEKISNGVWKCKIIYSSHKMPGEGEHKLFKYIREQKEDIERNYIIYGLDADIIILSLTLPSHIKNVFVLREDLYCKENDFFLLNIDKIKECFIQQIKWIDNNTNKFNKELGVIDVVLLTFLVGNDFLPHLPGLEIAYMGIENLIKLYKVFGKDNGHLIYMEDGLTKINLNKLKIFFKFLGRYEEWLITQKVESNNFYYEDPLLIKYFGEKKNLEKYKKKYYKKKLKAVLFEDILQNYIYGLIWTLNYYTTNEANWNYYYPYYYSPFISDLEKFNYNSIIYSNMLVDNTYPSHSFFTLMCILPSHSLRFLPPEFGEIKNYECLNKYFPKYFNIDLEGKRKDYEGIPKIEFVNYELFKDIYDKIIKKVNYKDKIRNKKENLLIYEYSNELNYFSKTLYGTIENCKVMMSIKK